MSQRPIRSHPLKPLPPGNPTPSAQDAVSTSMINKRIQEFERFAEKQTVTANEPILQDHKPRINHSKAVGQKGTVPTVTQNCSIFHLQTDKVNGYVAYSMGGKSTGSLRIGDSFEVKIQKHPSPILSLEWPKKPMNVDSVHFDFLERFLSRQDPILVGNVPRPVECLASGALNLVYYYPHSNQKSVTHLIVTDRDVNRLEADLMHGLKSLKNVEIMRFLDLKSSESPLDFSRRLKHLLIDIVIKPDFEKISYDEGVQAGLYLEKRGFLPRGKMDSEVQFLLNQKTHVQLEQDNSYWIKFYFELSPPNVLWTTVEGLDTIFHFLNNVETVQVLVGGACDVTALVSKFPKASFALLGNICYQENTVPTVSLDYGTCRIVAEEPNGYLAHSPRGTCHVAKACGPFYIGDRISVMKGHSKDVQILKRNIRQRILVIRLSAHLGFTFQNPQEVITIPEWVPKALAFTADVFYPSEDKDGKRGVVSSTVTRFHQKVRMPENVIEKACIAGAIAYRALQGRTDPRCHFIREFRILENGNVEFKIPDGNLWRVGTRFKAGDDLEGVVMENLEVGKENVIKARIVKGKWNEGHPTIPLFVQQLPTNLAPQCIPLTEGFLRRSIKRISHFINDLFELPPRNPADDLIQKVTAEKYEDWLEIKERVVQLARCPRRILYAVLARANKYGRHLVVVRTLEDVSKIETILKRQQEEKILKVLKNIAEMVKPQHGFTSQECCQIALYFLNKGIIREQDLSPYLLFYVKKAEKADTLAVTRWEVLYHRLQLDDPTIKVITFDQLATNWDSFKNPKTVQMMNMPWPVLVPIFVKFPLAKIGIIGTLEDDEMGTVPFGNLDLMKLQYPMLNIENYY